MTYVNPPYGGRNQNPAIIIAPYQWAEAASIQFGATHLVSILGDNDRLPWPKIDGVEALRLNFDDTCLSTTNLCGPSSRHIRSLVEFARQWGGKSSIVVHCRAGVSRSSAAALIVAAAIGRQDLFGKLMTAKTYYRPNRRMLELAAKLLSDDQVRMLSPPDFSNTPVSEWGAAAIQL